MTQKRPKYYQQFCDAKSRCRNPNNKSFKNYGGRGIEFKFDSYDEFEKELGEKPIGYTLDRINNNGHYEVGNIRWASKEDQNRNRRKHKQHTVHVDSFTGYLGISFDKNRNKFLVRKKNKYIGRTKTLEEAINLWQNT